MNDHVAKPIDKERLVLCLLGHLGRSGAGGAPATAADAGELVEARGDIVGRFGGSLELIVQVLRRFVPDMQDLFAQLERQLGEGDVQGSAATLHTIKGSASTVGASALPAVPASWSRPCAAPTAARHEILAGIRLDELRTCAMPACSACRRCSATCRRSRRAEPRRGGQSRQGSADPGLACIRCGCRANNAMGVIRRYS